MLDLFCVSCQGPLLQPTQASEVVADLRRSGPRTTEHAVATINSRQIPGARLIFPVELAELSGASKDTPSSGDTSPDGQ